MEVVGSSPLWVAKVEFRGVVATLTLIPRVGKPVSQSFLEKPSLRGKKEGGVG